MKKISLIFTSILSFSVHAMSATGHLNLIDQQRQRDHAEAFEQIKDLNYLRMKIQSIQSGLSGLNADWQSLAKKCNPRADAVTSENCYSRLGAIADAARMQQSQLDVLTTATHYQKLLREKNNEAVRVQDLMTAANRSLESYLTSVNQLRRNFGLRLAEIKFKKALAEIQAADQKAKVHVQCRLAPSQLGRQMITAQLSRSQADAESSPYLILRGDAIAREVTETAELLKNKCPAERAQQFDGLISQAQVFLAGTPASQSVQTLAQKGCRKMSASAQAELKAACRKAEFNPAILYSLHRELSKSRAKQ